MLFFKNFIIESLTTSRKARGHRKLHLFTFTKKMIEGDFTYCWTAPHNVGFNRLLIYLLICVIELAKIPKSFNGPSRTPEV